MLASHLTQVTYPGLDLSPLYAPVPPLGHPETAQEVGAGQEQAQASTLANPRHRARPVRQPVEGPAEITVMDHGDRSSLHRSQYRTRKAPMRHAAHS